MKKTVFLLSAVFLILSLSAETRVKEKVYVSNENGRKISFSSVITYKNYKIWDRKWVYLFSYDEKGNLIEDWICPGCAPQRCNTVSGDSIDGRPVWECADSSYDHEIVFPSDYALEKIFVRYIWENDLQDDSEYYDFDPKSLYTERFAKILSRVGKNELRLMRNTIYARYNYPFKSKDLQEIFSSIFDYFPDPNVTAESIEKVISKHNKLVLEMIIEEEKRR